MSRPHGVPPGDAYCPQIDSVASLKELPNITPKEIIHHQAQSKQTELFMQGVKNPKNKFEYVPFDDVRLLCESSGPEPRPFIPDTLQQKVLQQCHDLDHCGQRRGRKCRAWIISQCELNARSSLK